MPDTRRPQGRRFADTPRQRPAQPQQYDQDSYGYNNEQPQQQPYQRQQYQRERQAAAQPRQSNRRRLVCKKCGSDNVTVSVDHTAVARKKNGCLYWIFIGWWYHFFYWIFFKVWVNLFRRITNKGSKSIDYSEHKTAICQDCGNSWKL